MQVTSVNHTLEAAQEDLVESWGEMPSREVDFIRPTQLEIDL